jgi:hypothetical protein
MAKRYGAERLSIATPLKRICQELFAFSDEQVFGDAKIKETVDERWGVTPRLMMQKLSVAGRDNLGADVWIRGLVNHIEQSDKELFVIEDMRFVNEARIIHELCVGTGGEPIRGYVIKLECTDKYSEDAGTHPSEAEVDKVPMGLLSALVSSHISEGSVHLRTTLDLFLRELKIV